MSSAAPHPLKKPIEVGDYDRKHVNLAEGLLSSQIPLDKVEVKANPIHGRGVFAKQTIQEGDLITIYPAHYISIHGRGKPGLGGFKRFSRRTRRKFLKGPSESYSYTRRV